MMKPDRFPEWQARLRAVLNTVWDPIGDCPPDEYDSYNVALTTTLEAGAEISDESLFRYLFYVETEVIGILREDRPATIARRERTIQAIRSLGPPARQ